MSPEPQKLVVTILPPHEGFGPAGVGAVGTVARLLTGAPGFRSLVIGGPQANPPYRDLPFRAVRPALWWPGNVNIRYAAALAGPLARARPALIEVHNRPELALWLARRFRRCPVMLFLHNDPQGMRRARTAAQRTHLLHALARIVTVSDYLRDRLLHGVTAPPRPPAVLPNPIDLAALPPPVPRQRLILFAGRIVRDKGPDVFVAACAAALPHLPGWHAEMIGADRFRADSPDTDFARATRIAAEGAGVRALGYRDRATVLQAMARAAIVVVPSRWQEPFGLVALEAMASGAALICSGRGGLREVAGDAAVYVDPDDPAAWSAAIRALAGDPARRAALAQAGQERARRFDAPVIAARLAELRREVLAAAGG
ncbi:MAG TPA: glycosyltransferase family 4 protein [Acetobacteraceae bacterium]|nr:glycosyltransferase family 4 protein [Acetobacteraceae bacterium]